MIIYIQNRKDFYSVPIPNKEYSLGIVIPCYNEKETIEYAIKNFLKSNYKNLKKIVVVDDCSTDGSYEIAKKLEEKYPLLQVVQTPKNTGGAAGSKNFGAKFIDTELIGFSDSDSFPKEDAIENMVGYFNDPKVGAVTSRVLVKNRNKFLAKLQSIEYKVIAFTRKLLGFVESIYVTNGPLSIYRKSGFDELNGFDEKNMTEDIELTWHFVSKGYKIHMSILAKVYTIVPSKLKQWFKQRLRWNIGGLQTISKYKKKFLETGMLGKFILPYFVFSWILGITGFGILVYRMSRRIIVNYLSTKYSVESEVAIITLSEINLPVNVLLFFGLLLIFLSFSFTILALIHSREKEFKNYGLFHIIAYGMIYLLLYPPLLITSMYKYARGKYSW
jgi:cellulose synthase/poly-beta-1,6-N-acetylglucosamine synthase-like glycosyltransferase